MIIAYGKTALSLTAGLCLGLLGSSTAQGTQWKGISPESVLLKGHIPETNVEVSVGAELAPPKGDDSSSSIGILSVSYGPYRATVPDQILSRAVDPRLDDIEMSFCCWGVSFEVVEDEVRMMPVDGELHSTIAIAVPYGTPYLEPGHENEYSDAGPEPTFPYLSIHIHDGSVIGFEAWRYNGKQWVFDKFDWKDGKAVLTDSYQGDE